MRKLFARHVGHQLAAYVEGQLSDRQTQQVRQHIARCDACRDKLAHHERLAADLRLALRHDVRLSPRRVEALWEALRAQPIRRTRWAAPRALAPVLLALLLLATSFVMGHPVAGTQAQALPGTFLLPDIDTTLAPPAGALGGVATSMTGGHGLPTATFPAPARLTAQASRTPLPGPSIPPAPAMP